MIAIPIILSLALFVWAGVHSAQYKSPADQQASIELATPFVFIGVVAIWAAWGWLV